MQVIDSLKSLVSGLGTAKDKKASQYFGFCRLITDEELNAMHRTDWLSRKIVDIIPNDMTREWRDWQATGDQIEKIEELENLPIINLRVKVNAAMQKARLLGGAAIYMGMRDNAPSEPLDVERVGLGDLLYLHVLTRREITAGPINYDVTSEFYGQPTYYQVSTPNMPAVQVDPSRVVRFVGAEILDSRFQQTWGWGDSILQVVYSAIQNSISSQEHVASLIPEAKTDVVYVPGLSEYAASIAGQAKLTSRFTYANMAKSMFNMILLDGTGQPGMNQGEKWEQKQISFSQLPELLASFLQIASGAADIPVTRLIGQSPRGLNATGDADIRNYYDNISARQKTELQPALHRLDEVIIRSALGMRDPAIYYTWAPLWGMSDTEKAANFKTKADAARAIAGAGPGQQPLMPIEALSDAFVNMLIEDGSLPGLDTAIEEYGTLAEQEEESEPDETVAAMTPTPADPLTQAAVPAVPPVPAKE